ncbi:hypothetical protein VTI28DRAFT_6025 [Corynascus sepedonium]
MATLEEPVFFELSWSILSTIGSSNVLFGLFVVSITNFSPIAAVPIITSAAAAIANGLCYYAFYMTTQPPTNQAVASAFADILWLIQEAGLSFYSYIILSRILSGKQWYIFASSFWTILLGIITVRILIAVTRVRFIVGSDIDLQTTVNRLHMAYFPLIAVLECISAYYLLSTFAEAKSSMFRRATKLDLFHYLMRSTEIRMALLAVVGIMRAVTYSFQATAQSATNTAGQLDRFAYTMECLFPILMYIDMLSSKIVHSQSNAYGVSLRTQHDQSTPNRRTRRFVTTSKSGGDCNHIFTTDRPADHEQAIEITGGRASPSSTSSKGGRGRDRGNNRDRSSSRERIIRRGPSFEYDDRALRPNSPGVELDSIEPAGIHRTVEFGVRVSRSRAGGDPSPA